MEHPPIYCYILTGIFTDFIEFIENSGIRCLLARRKYSLSIEVDHVIDGTFPAAAPCCFFKKCHAAVPKVMTNRRSRNEGTASSRSCLILMQER